jgi:hypothetical protein
VRRQREQLAEQAERIERLESALERVLARLDPDNDGDIAN